MTPADLMMSGIWIHRLVHTFQVLPMPWKHTFTIGAKFNLRGIGHKNGGFCELCIRPDVYELAMKTPRK